MKFMNVNSALLKNKGEVEQKKSNAMRDIFSAYIEKNTNPNLDKKLCDLSFIEWIENLGSSSDFYITKDGKLEHILFSLIINNAYNDIVRYVLKKITEKDRSKLNFNTLRSTDNYTLLGKAALYAADKNIGTLSRVANQFDPNIYTYTTSGPNDLRALEIFLIENTPTTPCLSCNRDLTFSILVNWIDTNSKKYYDVDKDYINRLYTLTTKYGQMQYSTLALAVIRNNLNYVRTLVSLGALPSVSYTITDETQIDFVFASSYAKQVYKNNNRSTNPTFSEIIFSQSQEMLDFFHSRQIWM